MISLGLWFHEMNVFGQMVVSLWFVGVCICMYANKAFVRNKTNGNLSLSFCYLFSKSLSFHFQVSVCGCVWFALSVHLSHLGTSLWEIGIKRGI